MRLAVLGFSSAGRRHAAYLRELGHEVTVFDPQLSDAQPGMARADSVEAALEATEAVVVASPTSLHAEQAELALKRGRHVLVEKPLAATAAEGERLAEVAESSGVVCAVAMNLRFHRAILELRRLAQSGELGEIRFAAVSVGYDLAKWRPEKDYRQTYSGKAALGGGIVLDGIHELDYLVWILGPVHSVSAEVAKVSSLEIDVEDIALANLRFRAGPVAAVELNYLDQAYRRTCLLVGSSASARWDWTEGVISISRGGHHDERSAAEIVDASFPLATSYRDEMDDFLRALSDDAHAPRTGAEDAVEALRVADAIKQSSAEGRRLVLHTSQT